LGVWTAVEWVLLLREDDEVVEDFLWHMRATSESLLGESSMETETNGGNVPMGGMDTLLGMGSGRVAVGA
jgi:hypothetical protein